MNGLKFLLAACVVAGAAVVQAGHSHVAVNVGAPCCDQPAVQVQSVPQTVTRTRMVPTTEMRTRIKKVPRQETRTVTKVRMVPEEYQVEEQYTVYDDVEEQYEVTVCVPETYTETICTECVQPQYVQQQCVGTSCWSHDDLAEYHAAEALDEMQHSGEFSRWQMWRARRAAKKAVSWIREPGH